MSATRSLRVYELIQLLAVYPADAPVRLMSSAGDADEVGRVDRWGGVVYIDGIGAPEVAS